MIPGELAAWGWLALRLFALLRAQTIWRVVAGASWWAIAGALALGLAALWRPAAPAAVTPARWIVGAGFEVLLGATIGALVSLPGEAALGAGRCSVYALGHRHARAFVALQLTLAAALALSLELHHPLLAGLSEVAARWPVGDPAAWVVALDRELVVGAAHDLTLLALGLATPVLLTAAVVELALALAAPAGPWAALAGAVRPWLVAAAALAALGAAWAIHPEAWLRAFSRV